jgi:hypothetical protein
MRKTMCACWLPALLIGIVLPSLAPAQDDGARGLTFRGKPKPWADSFVITEFGIVGSPDPDAGATLPSDVLFTLDIGWMSNRTERYALGGSMAFTWEGLSSDHVRSISLHARFRYWPQRLFSIDVAPGLVFGANGSSSVRFPSVRGHVAVGFADWVSAVVQVDHLRRESRSRKIDETVVYLGARLGSYPGAIAGVAAGIMAMGVHALSYGLD